MKKKKLILGLMFLASLMSCKKEGCTDPTAINFNPQAELDDGSCEFGETETPLKLECNMYQEEGKYTLEDRGDGVDYIIDCVMPVKGDLVIEPGVVIEFTSDAGIRVEESGSLKAIGNDDVEGKEVVFTGEDKIKGSWKGILFDSPDVKNELNNCIIEYAGGGSFNSNGDKGAVILWSDTKIKIKNCKIRNSDSYGINASYGDDDLEISNNTISYCKGVIKLNADYVGAILSGTFTENIENYIAINTWAGQGYVETDQTWKNHNIPYRVKNANSSTSWNVSVREGANLTIEKGTTIEFETETGIAVNQNSSFKAVGTENEKIVFTGVNKIIGAWQGIAFDRTNSPLNEISYATIEYSGESSHKGAIYMWGEPDLKLNNVEFKEIEACAIYDAPNDVKNPNLILTNVIYTTVNNQNNSQTIDGNDAYCIGG